MKTNKAVYNNNLRELIYNHDKNASASEPCGYPDFLIGIKYRHRPWYKEQCMRTINHWYKAHLWVAFVTK